MIDFKTEEDIGQILASLGTKDYEERYRIKNTKGLCSTGKVIIVSHPVDHAKISNIKKCVALKILRR